MNRIDFLIADLKAKRIMRQAMEKHNQDFQGVTNGKAIQTNQPQGLGSDDGQNLQSSGGDGSLQPQP